MSDRQEFRQKLAARLRQVARDLLDHVAIANNQEQKRNLSSAFAMIQIAEELLSLADANEFADSRRDECGARGGYGSRASRRALTTGVWCQRFTDGVGTPRPLRA
jgi:hypothetical protein